MRLRTAVIGFAALTVASPAFASEWWYIGTSRVKPNRNVIFIDRESIQRSASGNVTFWETIVYETPEKESFFSKSASLRVIVDCNRRMVGYSSVVWYNQEGTVLNSHHEEPGLIKFNDIGPDTVADNEMKFSCPVSPDESTVFSIKNKPLEATPIILKILDKPAGQK